MKIAICYSGQFRVYDGWRENHISNLPEADYYYSTWDYERPKIDVKNMIYFSQPNVDYNCYAGSFSKKYGERLQKKASERVRLHSACLQHLAHWFILQELKQDYDVVIRMRYDTFLGNHKEGIRRICKLSSNTGKAIGIGNSNSTDDKNMHIHKSPLMLFGNEKTEYMLDFMTIHKPENIANVLELHEKKQLWPTNAGWWLILSKPGFGHINYRGTIQLARKLGLQVG